MRRTAPLAAGLLLAASLALGGCGTGGSAYRDRPTDQVDDKPPVLTADTYFAAGQLAESQGDAVRAADQYDKALALNPTQQQSLYHLAALQSRGRQHAAALETWRRYVDATGGSAEAYSNLGYASELAGQNAAAETAYRQGIARDGANESCRVNYGLMLARLGKEQRAAAQLATVLPPAEVQYNLGSVHELAGDTAAARANYRKALALDPGYQDAIKRLAALDFKAARPLSSASAQ